GDGNSKLSWGPSNSMHTRRSHLVLLGLIILALIGVALIGIPGSPAHKNAKLGLDLQGGIEVVLKATPPKGTKVTNDGLDTAVNITRDRRTGLGVSETDARKQQPDQIVTQLRGVKTPARAASIVGETAQLELYDLETSLLPPSITATGLPNVTTSLYDLLAGQ